MHTHLHTHLPKESSYDSWEKKKVETEWLPGEGKGAALFLKPVSFLPSLKKSPKSGVNNTHSVQELVQERNMRQRVQCSSVPLLSLCSALMFFYRIINYTVYHRRNMQFGIPTFEEYLALCPCSSLPFPVIVFRLITFVVMYCCQSAAILIHITASLTTGDFFKIA